MDWKEIEWSEPPKRVAESIGESDMKEALLRALFGDSPVEEKALEYLAANWAKMGEPRSMPVSLHAGVLFVRCISAPARQNLVLKFPGIQREIQQRFGMQIKHMRFEKKAAGILPQKEKTPKNDETKKGDTDIVKSESPLIYDIRRILGL